MGPDKFLTISVDDGHPLDHRSAELLSKYGLKATFYIPKKNPERDVMPESDMRKLAQSFEIGGHTYGHRPLHNLPEAEVIREIQEGKDWLEQLLGRTAVAFCYPRGKFNAVTVRAVRNAGFKGARTCMYNLNDIPADPFLWGLSTHAYSHSVAIQVRHAILELNFKGLMNFFLVHQGSVDWVDHFKRAVGYVQKNGGIAHLYYHSWEIDALNAWGRLEDLFRYLADCKDLRRVTNGEFLTMCQERKRAA